MKKLCALFALIAVTLSGCYVDPYHRGLGEGGYERDRDQHDRGEHDRNREERGERRDRDDHDSDH